MCGDISDVLGAVLAERSVNDARRAARPATVGPSKTSLNDSSTPKRSRSRANIRIIVIESAPSARISSSAPIWPSSSRSPTILASCHSSSDRGGIILLPRSASAVGSAIPSASASSPRLIFPAGPFGIPDTMRTRPGILNLARRSAAKSRRPCAVASAPWFNTTAAATSSPSLGMVDGEYCGLDHVRVA